MNNVMFITLVVALVAIVIIIAILLYNQMLIINEVNKRLLLLAKDSVENERSTQEELTDALRQLDAATNEIQTPKTPEAEISLEDEEETFDPHTYNE